AIVFTIASVYTGRDVTFRHVIKIVPKIWKRLIVTLAYIYVALFIYNVVYGVLVVIARAIFGFSTIGSVVTLVLLVLYIFGFLYLSVVWQLASVVTVLENVNGFKAMKKGKSLLHGKKVVGVVLAFVMYVILVGLIIVLELFVGSRYGDYVFGIRIIWRAMIGILCGVVLLVWFLLFIVIQTVLYLVCKSFHREAIDKLSLSTFLGAYNGETIVLPNSSQDIQLGRTQASV
nr:NADH-ubiquinone oxidoreductase chain 5-like [Tanacetum cinerariifolium]